MATPAAEPAADHLRGADGCLEQEPLSPREGRFATGLMAASAVDLLGSAVFAGFAFKYAYRDEGASLYCLGVQALSHWLSSMALVLRFMYDMLPPREDDSAVSDGLLLREQRRRDLRRERSLAVCMAMTMVACGATLAFKACRKIKLWDVWYLDHGVYDHEIHLMTSLMSWWGFAGYVLQAGMRFFAARVLRRAVVWHAFTLSAVTVAFLLALGVAATWQREWSWKAEPVCAIGLVCVMVCEGLVMVASHHGDVELMLEADPRV